MGRAKSVTKQGTALDKVDKMWQVYFDTRSPKEVEKQCKVGQATVYKYLNEGDPRRGILPFKERLAKINQDIIASDNESLAVEEKRRRDALDGAFWAIYYDTFEEIVNPNGERTVKPRQGKKVSIDHMMKIATYLATFGHTIKVEHEHKLEDFLKEHIATKKADQPEDEDEPIDVDWEEVESKVFASDLDPEQKLRYAIESG